jgi:hypothetical protein
MTEAIFIVISISEMRNMIFKETKVLFNKIHRKGLCPSGHSELYGNKNSLQFRD